MALPEQLTSTSSRGSSRGDRIMFSNIEHYYIVFVNGPDKATCVACDKAVEIGVVIDNAGTLVPKFC